MKLNTLLLLIGVLANFSLQPTQAQQTIILDPLPNLVQPGPIQQGPIYSGPVYSTPVYVEPIISQPIRPIYLGPIQTAPIQPDPIQTGPIQTGPIDLKPTQPQPAPAATSFTGRIVFNNFEGGFYGVVSDNGARYTGAIPEALKQDGMRVKGKVQPRSNQLSTRMWGTIVDFVEISAQ